MTPPALACLSAVAWMASMLPSASAAAQTIDHPPPNASAESSAAQAYRDALASHAAGDLQGALRLMQESYRLSQRAELLYNIARIESELGDCAASLADYRRYLDLVPQGTYRAAAEDASRRLGAECLEPPSSSAAASAPAATRAMLASPALQPASLAPPLGPPPPAQGDTSATPMAEAAPPYWTTPRILGWSALAAGTLAGVASIQFAVSAADAHSRFQTSVDSAEAGGTPVDYELEDEQHRDQRWARALGVTGGALLVSGALLLILAPTPSENAPIARLQLQPGLLRATFAQRF